MAASNPLTIRMFGAFASALNGVPLACACRNEQLLALLVLRRVVPTERAWLAATLWPEAAEANARFYLRRTLAALRQALGTQAGRLLAPNAHTLQLDLSGVDCDLVAFDTALMRGDRAALEEAIALYRGPLLEGWYEEWALLDRGMREQKYLDALEALARDGLAGRAPAEAARHLRALLAIEPLRERAQRSLMEALAATGDYAAVTQTYRDFRLLLHEEMHTAPALETRALYQQLHREGQQRTEQNEGRKTKRELPNTQHRARNLPRPITTLIGREEAIQEVAALLAKARLVTLTGAGGVGKTRLAIAAAEVVEPDFPDGAWFVDLSPLSDGSLVSQAVAAALELRPEPGRPLDEILRAFLARKELLLILDNCEHLQPACAALSRTLLNACPGVSILTTSRQTLGITSEQCWRVPSLSLPDLSVLSHAGKEAETYLLESAAAQLFLERAHAVYSHFRVTAQNCVAVGQTCCLLDGIPFAIELAAAWARVLPVGEIVRRIGERLDLLTNADRTVPTRQQTLRAALDWSCGLLSEQEHRLLRRLSVFAGGWSLAAVEAVCGEQGEAPDAMLMRLARLVDQSLVVYEEREGKARYQLLETTRQYAREKLRQSGEESGIGARHRDYFLHQLESGLDGKIESHDWGRVRWKHRAVYHRWCEAERDNCREALRFSLEEPEGATAALRLGALLWSFWHDAGEYREGNTWLNAALQKDVGTHSRDRMRVLRCAGLLAMFLSDGAAARRFIEEGLAIAREQEPGFVVHLLDVLGYLSGLEAQPIWEERVERARKDGDPILISDALDELGKFLLYTGRESQARPVLEEALDYAVHSQDLYYTMRVKAVIAELEQSGGDFGKALRLFEEILVYLRESGIDPYLLAWICLRIGKLKCLMGDLAAMPAHFGEAIQLFQRVGDTGNVIMTLEAIAIEEYRAFATPTKQNAERAARLLGAGEWHRNRRNFPHGHPSDTLPPDHDLMLHMRTALGKEAFARACAVGAAMSLDEAVAYALQPQADL